MESSWRAGLALVVIVLSFSFAPAMFAGVTEAEAIRLFLEESPQSRRGSAVERIVDAESRIGAQFPNPDVAYQVEDSAGVRDEFLTVEQGIPITGRRRLLGQRADAAVSAAALHSRADLQADVYGLKRVFHEVLYRQRVLETLLEGESLLAETVGILQQREREGDGAGYDVLRAEQELAELRMTAAQADAALSAARSSFGAFFDPELRLGSAILEGRLAPSGPTPSLMQALERAFEQRLDLKALSAERRRADLDRRAARRRRIPEPVVTAGWKRTESLGLSDTGYVAAVTVPLPVFNRGRLEAARATAEGERLALDEEILVRGIRAEVEAAVARETAIRSANEKFGNDVERRAVEVTRIARMKYDEGESGILELLDTHRTSLRTQLRALAARYEARRAEIDRQYITGQEVKP